MMIAEGGFRNPFETGLYRRQVHGNLRMAIWREKLFVLMGAQCDQSDSVFPIPPERVVERGVQVEM